MGSHRNALVIAVRQELAEARGAARAVLVAAETAQDEAENRKKLVRDAYATCLNQLAEARDAARRDIERRYEYESGRLASNVRHLAALCASGAAGLPWRMWSPTEPDPGARPGLLRIGTLALDDAVALPGLVPLLDAAHLELSGEQDTVDGVISGLLLRALGSSRAGEVQLTVYDPEHLGGTLAAFAPLGISSVGPGGLGALLDDLVEHICRVNERVLASEHANLADLVAASDGPRPEPWRVVVLLADQATADELTAAQRAQLGRIARTGVACGVHLIVRGLELAEHPTVRKLEVREGKATCDLTGELEIRLDPPPPADRVTGFCRSTAERLKAGPPPARLADLEPPKIWSESSAHGLIAPIGEGTDQDLVDVALGDDPPHALIGGPAGSGKTNLIYAWLAALTTRYGPDELDLYLLGPSFERFVPGPKDSSWLPQARMVGLGRSATAVLRRLGEQARLRANDPASRRHRIVVVIDGLPALPVAPLVDLARHGSALGIHLVLAGSAVDPALAGHFTLRIALPKARGILADDNLAAAVIPRHHAVVNAESGAAGANRIVRVPDAGDPNEWRGIQRRLWRARPADCPAPVVHHEANDDRSER